MPTIGQCEKCGTALNDLNVSDLYPELCRGCAYRLPGDRDKAIQVIAERGRVLLVDMKHFSWYIWVYVVGGDRYLLDLLRRSYGGRLQPHGKSAYKWTCSSRRELLGVAIDLHEMKYNLSLTADILAYCRETDSKARAAIVEGMYEDYEGKCLPILPPTK